jgi:hypothetical protein
MQVPIPAESNNAKKDAAHSKGAASFFATAASTMVINLLKV